MEMLITYPWPSSQPCLWKLFPESHQGVQISWAWAAHSPCLAPCTFLQHKLVSVDWLCYISGEQIHVPFSNRINVKQGCGAPRVQFGPVAACFIIFSRYYSTCTTQIHLCSSGLRFLWNLPNYTIGGGRGRGPEGSSWLTPTDGGLHLCEKMKPWREAQGRRLILHIESKRWLYCIQKNNSNMSLGCICREKAKRSERSA